MPQSLVRVPCRVWRQLLVLALVLMTYPKCSTGSELHAARPNIVMILSDDMGYSQPGFTGGNPELTPNMDRLAS